MPQRFFSACFATAIAMMLAAAPAFAQATATITGTVADPSGAVVAGAKVSAKNLDTAQERTLTTQNAGLYRFESLPPGTYKITVQMAGFATSEVNKVLLQVGDLRDVNFSLQIAKQAGEVVVTGEAPLIESTKTEISSVIDSDQVSNLPTTTSFGGVGGVSNDFASLATLAPGVKYDLSGNSADLIGPGSVNNRGVLVNIDGGNISDQIGSSRDALGASIDEVQEFQVLTNSYNAEYGQAGGVILNVITKSGTNQFHGDGHIYFRGRNLEASNFFYNLTPEAAYRRAPFFKREGGFTFGGPLIKDKTFFFGSYELTHQGSPATISPPTGIMTINQPTNELLYSGRLDHQLTSNNHIFVRYNAQRDLQDNLIVQVPNFASPESLVSSVVHDDTLNITDTWTSGTVVNEGRFFWHRFLSATPDKSSEPAELGPNFYFGAAFCCPQGALQNRYQYMDNLSVIKGTHTFKAGFNISHFPYNSLFQQYHFGEYSGFGAYPNTGLPTALTIAIGPGSVTASDNILGFYVQDTWKILPNVTLNYGLRYDLELGAFDGGTIPKPGGGCYQGNGIIPACSSDKNNFQPRFGVAWSPKPKGGFLGKIFGENGQSVIRASFAEVTELAYLNIVLDSLNFDGVNLLTTTTSDPAILKYFPNAPPASVLATLVPQGSYGRVRPIADNLKNPEVRNAAFSISRQIGKDFAVEVGFLGVYGFGLFGESDVNYPQVIADPAHPGFYYFGNRPNPAFLAIRTNENSRTSSYNSGYLRVDKRFSSHYRFQTSYTYAKQLATSEDFYGTSEPGNPFDLRADRGPSQSDLRHQLSMSFIYDTGSLVHAPVVNHILNNVSVGVVGQAQSARPYPLSTGDAPFSSDFFPGVGAETQQRPSIDANGNVITTNIASTSGTNLLVSQAGHAACPACPQTTFLAPPGANPSGPIDSITGDPVDFQFLNGNLGRDVARGSPYVRFDMSVIKTIKVGEKLKVELKADAFNVLNHTNFLLYNNLDTTNLLPVSTNPNCTLCLNATTGFIVGAQGQILNIKNLQHGRVSPNLLDPIFGGIGDPATADIPRQIQLALRFRF